MRYSHRDAYSIRVGIFTVLLLTFGTMGTFHLVRKYESWSNQYKYENEPARF